MPAWERGRGTYSLWHAVDEDGMEFTILVPEQRNQEAAETFLHWEVAGQPGEPQVVVTEAGTV